jgi:hypothetical protein
VGSSYINHFLQPDSLIPNPPNPQAWNRYSYVRNNPVNYNDPTGHSENNCGDNGSLCGGSYGGGPYSGGNDGGGGGNSNNYDDDEGGGTSDVDNDPYNSVVNLKTDDEINNPLIDIWNQDGEAVYDFFDNGCDDSMSGFLNNAACLDDASLITQDLATLFSSAGATVALFTTLLGCIATEVGCGVGYMVGTEIHIAFFNPYESVFSGISFVTTVRSDWRTRDTYFNSLHNWEVGEDTITGFATFLPGQLTADPLIDAGIDIYASGYNHSYFCGASSILDCLP